MSGYTVHIRRNATGEIRTYHIPYAWDVASDFLWAEGNNACDHNRAIFFHTDEEKNKPDFVEITACDDGLYDIVRIVRDDGADVVLDFS